MGSYIADIKKMNTPVKYAICALVLLSAWLSKAGLPMAEAGFVTTPTCILLCVSTACGAAAAVCSPAAALGPAAYIACLAGIGGSCTTCVLGCTATAASPV